jgi:hypothetical protein
MKIHTWFLVVTTAIMVSIVFTLVLSTLIGVSVIMGTLLVLFLSKKRGKSTLTELGIETWRDSVLFAVVLLFTSSILTILITALVTAIDNTVGIPIGGVFG